MSTRFRKATPSQILTLNILAKVDILEAYRGFGIDAREVPAVKAQKLIEKLREAELKRLQRNLERVAREAEERRERQRVNHELATWFGVTTR